MAFINRKLATDSGIDANETRASIFGMRRRAQPHASIEARQQATYEALLEQCWDKLWRYAYNTTGNVHDAGDLLSETTVEGFRGFAGFRGDTTFLRWMYRVMTTTRIDMLRKNRRHNAQSLDAICESGERVVPAIADSGSDPEQIVLRHELSEPVQRALGALSEEFRAVVVLADMEELDYVEVSQVLQIPVGTVRSRLHRARTQLRGALAAHVEDCW